MFVLKIAEHRQKTREETIYMTDFLFAKPSFISGMGMAIDLGATMGRYNFSETPEEADARAIYNDFSVVGEEMRKAIGVLAAEHADRN